MIAITERIAVPAPLAEVWPVLCDPLRVAACLPGAQVLEHTDDDRWLGSIEFRFGPTRAVFRGEARLAFDHAQHRCTIDARGVDQRGASRATAEFVISAQGDAQTELSIEGQFNVGGPLAMFANAGGVHLARAMLAQFAANLAALVAGPAPVHTDGADVSMAPAPATQPAGQREPARPAASGFQLLWDALLRWWRDRVGTSGKQEK
ncbi:MAG: SRPBCC family protein [Burkholderiaceae bacterium]|nr:SRPBCC family protein [Burkholderiaceae bacterium]